MATKGAESQPLQAKVTIDLGKISESDFDAKRPLRVAAVKGDEIVDQKTVVPAKEKDPRRFDVTLSVGAPEDGVAGAQIVVAPADDERNIFSRLAARKFVSGKEARIDGGIVSVSPAIWGWWRFCWFPRTYRVTGRVARHDGDCTHPIGAAQVELYDVDYCWWWYNQSLLATANTDADGFFDITFTWCVPLWCLIDIFRPPLYIDPDLLHRVREIVDERTIFPVTKFPPPPPPDPFEWERRLAEAGVDLAGIPRRAPLPMGAAPAVLAPARMKAATPAASAAVRGSASRAASAAANVASSKLSGIDLFGGIIFWPPCDSPCDWYPDVKIRVTQNQPGGTVTIYEDSFFQIHWNLDHDLLNLNLEANASALYADDCRPDPLLGNCMLFERVGNFNVSTIYQPDIGGGFSYGATPDRRQRLGYTVSKDRAWCLTLGVHGDFGLAAGVDYYQVQVAQWTEGAGGDLLSWDADHRHVPPAAAFAPVDVLALGSFTRTYAERVGFFYHWRNETFGPQTVGGIDRLYKSRQRFEQDYRDSHGGANPAPDFASGWYWDTGAMTRLFHVDTSRFSNGYYSFRLIGYRQTGVDGMGQPILTPVDMGIPGGVGRRCGGLAIPELVTLRFFNDPHRPACEIVSFKKNGVTTIDECAIVVLDTTDNLQIEYSAQDSGGNLEFYGVTLQRGDDAPQNIRGPLIGGSVTIVGTTPAGPDYLDALVDPVTPAIPPVWTGGSWVATVPASAFATLGGSCAYNLRLDAWDRQTDGWTAGVGWGEVGCEKNRAFTVILAADRGTYCAQLGCP
jgi:hypothetical protein